MKSNKVKVHSSFWTNIMKLLTSFLKLVLSILISTFLILPIFSLVFGINEIRRVFVKIYLNLKHGNKVILANGADGAHGHTSRALIRIFLVFNKNHTFSQFQTQVTNNILNLKDKNGEFVYKKFRSRFVSQAGYGCWITDENFDPKNHFRSLPEDPNMTESKLMQHIQDLDKEMPSDRPQWEVIFVPQLPESHNSGMIFRIHHSYGDGLSIINVFGDRLSSDKPFPYVIHPINYRPPFWLKLFFHIKGYAMFGWTFLSGILHPPALCPDRHPNAPEGLAHCSKIKLSLMQLKSIQRKTNGASVSSILMTGIKNSLDKINKEPLNLKSLIVVAKFPYPQGKLSNQIAALELNVPSKDEENWMSQLATVNNQAILSNNLTYFVNNTMNLLMGRMPSSVLKQMSASIKNLFLLSNLPFVTRSVTLGDAIVTDCYVWPTLLKSLFVSALSIGDNVDLTIQAGANILNEEELTVLVSELKHQLKTMEN